ncbi:putative CRIPT [Besnoitia besnoiti]|uniref:Cysteine-rich PDZ-binding protein n=1 Tax=Besnoitia besnoiti TaxID=94643 RepID=A0A2A9MQ10_BESBE|nr:putative CRIPT [Besnoitia besnoiti]PFH38010.1 putative CRIPT [Besnoitia besnoiti]
MPCEKCEKKMNKLVTPDPKQGQNRAVGVNKLIEKKAHKDQLAPKGSACKVCNTKLHWKGKYCPPCAHIKGRCWMCGKKIFDTSKHCMSLV